jgi:hypothetical protein
MIPYLSGEEHKISLVLGGSLSLSLLFNCIMGRILWRTMSKTAVKRIRQLFGGRSSIQDRQLPTPPHAEGDQGRSPSAGDRMYDTPNHGSSQEESSVFSSGEFSSGELC